MAKNEFSEFLEGLTKSLELAIDAVAVVGTIGNAVAVLVEVGKAFLALWKRKKEVDALAIETK